MQIDWKLVEYTAMAFVFLGCVGEILAEPLFPASERKKKRVERLSGVVLVAGLALELLATVRTNQISDKTIAALQKDAEVAKAASVSLRLEAARAQRDAEVAKAAAAGANAWIAASNERAKVAEASIAGAQRLSALGRAEAARANERAEKLELEASKQREKAASAERALLELQQRIQDRHVTAEQRRVLIEKLAGPLKEPITMVFCVNGPEPCTFAAEIKGLLISAGWVVGQIVPEVEMNPEGGPTGLAVRVHAASPAAALLSESLQAVGLPTKYELNSNVPLGAIELVVGNKPKR